MLVHSYTLYQQAGSFLIEDLYKLNLSATEQLWIFLAFFLTCLRFQLFLSMASKCAKAPAVGTMLSGIMLKMGLYSIIVGNYQLLH
jgi:NADH-quinone oxidoreductase subunit M